MLFDKRSAQDGDGINAFPERKGGHWFVSQCRQIGFGIKRVNHFARLFVLLWIVSVAKDDDPREDEKEMERHGVFLAQVVKGKLELGLVDNNQLP